MDWPDLAHHFLAAGVLAVFVTVIAYLHHPRLKTLVFCVPVPFVCAYQISGQPIDATHVIGLCLSVGYHWIVFGVRQRLGAPLGLGIALGVSFFLAAAVLLRRAEAAPFGLIVLLAVIGWVVAVRWYRPSREPGHRSAAPLWLKAPLTFLIALAIYSLTGLLAGAVTTFPYAGTFTSYEMRKSLKTLAGQYTINAITFLLMLVVIRYLEPRLPTPWPLALGVASLVVTLLGVYALGIGEPMVEGRT